MDGVRADSAVGHKQPLGTPVNDCLIRAFIPTEAVIEIVGNALLDVRPTHGLTIERSCSSMSWTAA